MSELLTEESFGIETAGMVQGFSAALCMLVDLHVASSVWYALQDLSHFQVVCTPRFVKLFRFFCEHLQLARGNCAMDVNSDEERVRGLRLKWRKQYHLNSPDVSAVTDAVDESHCFSGSALGSSLDVHSSWDAPGLGAQTGEDVHSPGLGLDNLLDECAVSEQYEPSVAMSNLARAEVPDVGGRSSAADDSAGVSDLFIRGARFSSIRFPWETPLMEQIFGEQHPTMKLSMPIDWGSSDVPLSEPASAGASEPVVPSETRWQVSSYVKHKSDATYLQQRDKTLHNAIMKWRFIALVDASCSEVGRQLDETDEDQMELVLCSAMGVKSPNTILKRANAMMLYYRWNAINACAAFLPFDECDVWKYVLSNSKLTSSSSRSHSFVQSLRFAHYMLGFDNALACANSKRVTGQAQIQLSLRTPGKQARPLTVDEVRALHAIADGQTHSKVDRCVASGLLFALYGRCRVSDLNYIHEILHDVSGGTGFVEVTTRHHKAARSVQQKAMLLPIVVSCAGVSQFPWIHSWIANRKLCNLPTSGMIQGAMMPAPILGDRLEWMKRPLSAGEVTGILKGFLKIDDSSLSSHSLKATTLSWAAKAEVPRDQRRILGRHASSVKDSDSFYSRDMSIGPVNSLTKVINMVRDGVFCPDATRANYFPHSSVPAMGTPAHVVMQPFTPAFLERAQPQTPGLEPMPSMMETKNDKAATADDLAESLDVKTEDSWSAIACGNSGLVIEISSGSEQDSSESETCPSTSSGRESIDLDPDDVGGNTGTQVPHEADVAGINVKNTKTKIVHEVRDGGLVKANAEQLDIDLVKGELTLCGHIVTGNYVVLQGRFDWTAKCRVCFKGRRGPS